MATVEPMKDTLIARDEAREWVTSWGEDLPEIPTNKVIAEVLTRIVDTIITQHIKGTLMLSDAQLTFKRRGTKYVVKDLEVLTDYGHDIDVVEVADATSDIVVVTKGSQATYGVPDVDGYDNLPDMEMVQKYMRVVCNQTIRTAPEANVGDMDKRLRANLIVEESLELLMLGFGMTLKLNTDKGNVVVDKSEIKGFDVELVEENKPVDIEFAEEHFIYLNIFAKQIDAIFGIPSDRVILDEVMRANLDKIWDDGKAHFREDGKNIKPPNHQPPNIKRVLLAHGWQE